MLSWTVFYNEAEPTLTIRPDHQQGSSVSQKNETYKLGVKRKLEAEDWLPSKRAIKLTKVGSSLLKIAHQPISQTTLAQQKNTSKCSPIFKKKMKALAREHSYLQACGSPQEVSSRSSYSPCNDPSLTSKMAKEAGLTMPQLNHNCPILELLWLDSGCGKESFTSFNKGYWPRCSIFI